MAQLLRNAALTGEPPGLPVEPIPPRPVLNPPGGFSICAERTGQNYMTDMAALYDRISTDVGKVDEGQLAAKDETIAELRRRAEVAEAQAALLAQREMVIAARHETIERLRDETLAVEEEPGLWAQLRRWWRG